MKLYTVAVGDAKAIEITTQAAAAPPPPTKKTVGAE